MTAISRSTSAKHFADLQDDQQAGRQFFRA